MPPVFAKSQYEAIAAAMQSAKKVCASNGTLTNEIAWYAIVGEISDTFAQDNPNFDRARFARACEPGANVRVRK